MKYKILVTAAVLSLALAAPAAAEIVEYSDEFVSFSYDTDMPGEVSVHSFGDEHAVNYSFTCAGNTSPDHVVYTLVINEKTDDFDQQFYDGLFESARVEINKIQDDDHILCYTTWKCETDDPALLTYSDAFLDSISIKEDLSSVDAAKVESQDLVSNAQLSDQAVTYAQSALDLLNKYMSMELDPADAAEQAEQLQTRIENYLDGDSYGYYDSQIKYAFFNMDFYLKYGHDDVVAQSIRDLEDILRRGNES